MFNSEPLAAVGWLICAVGLGIFGIGVFSPKSRERSPTRRIADALSGMVFILLGLTVILNEPSDALRNGLIIGAVAAALSSWYLGRHARSMDRAAKARSQQPKH
jgi:uncharacterized membrane protein